MRVGGGREERNGESVCVQQTQACQPFDRRIIVTVRLLFKILYNSPIHTCLLIVTTTGLTMELIIVDPVTAFPIWLVTMLTELIREIRAQLLFNSKVSLEFARKR